MNKYLKRIIQEVIEEVLEESNISEERIANEDAVEYVKSRENFVGSHTYGEDIGDLGKMYVAYSYGEQHPLFLWYDGKWYHNTDDYILPDGSVNTWTKKHFEQLKPTQDTIGRTKSWLKKKIVDFKKKYGVGDNDHTDLEPGEK